MQMISASNSQVDTTYAWKSSQILFPVSYINKYSQN
jgi:hypothetical protein